MVRSISAFASSTRPLARKVRPQQSGRLPVGGRGGGKGGGGYNWRQHLPANHPERDPSLAHADPAADYAAILLALDAGVRLHGPNGARSVPASDFFQGLFTVDLGADEIITGIRFAPAKVAAYAKLYQRASRFAIVGVAAALEVTDGKISSARLGLTGASTHATHAACGTPHATHSTVNHPHRAAHSA